MLFRHDFEITQYLHCRLFLVTAVVHSRLRSGVGRLVLPEPIQVSKVGFTRKVEVVHLSMHCWAVEA